MKIRGILVWVEFVSPFCTGHDTIQVYVVFNVKKALNTSWILLIWICTVQWTGFLRFWPSLLFVVCLSQSISNFYNFLWISHLDPDFALFLNVFYVFNCESNKVCKKVLDTNWILFIWNWTNHMWINFNHS